MNRPIRYAYLAALALALAAAPALAKKEKSADAEDTIAVVNGKAIPSVRANAIVAAQIAQGQPDSPQLRNAVREELVRREVLAQEAQKKGFEKKTDVQAQIQLARQGVLIGAYLNDYVRSHPITDEAIKKEYDTIRATLGDKEYKARHILVESDDEAKAIIDKLNKGEKFDELAKQSKDPGSKDRGGDLGWATPSSYVKPFSDALVKLEKGKFTQTPVKSDFGYHVIMLDDTRELKAPAFEEVKGQIAQRLQQKMVEQHIADLRAKAKVE
ncbi:MAG: peptidylprolyl isomerase [Rhodocyclaceae bacterium]|nr:peptidylprolyl isomerase [Rhodocyclaceae bacterium]